MTRLNVDSLAVTSFEVSPQLATVSQPSDGCVSPLCMTEGQECTSPWCKPQPVTG
jgi:hypothetical protein